MRTVGTNRTMAVASALLGFLFILSLVARIEARPLTPAGHAAAAPALQQGVPPQTDGASDRQYLVGVLTKTAQPVLQALADEQLHNKLPVHDWEQDRRGSTYTEAFARTFAGIAPWLELGPDTTPEGQTRGQFIDLTRRALINATDPKSADFLNWNGRQQGGDQIDQPLVEAAYLAYGLMKAPKQLFDPLTDAQKQNVLNALRASREIKNTHNNNWVLFPAMVEAALWQLGADHETDPIESGVDRIEGWYLGDGTYGDGPEYNANYYNSFVIHPMLLQVLRVADQQGEPVDDSLSTAEPRAHRYAEILERMISPEATFPVIGRSEAYRYAVFFHLADSALNHDLPKTLDPGAVRAGITGVVRRITDAPGTYDQNGWLNLGVVGSQPGVEEDYNATGSLYVALTGLVHLGLPANDPFWTAPYAKWSQLKIWSGEDIPRDKRLEEGSGN